MKSNRLLGICLSSTIIICFCISVSSAFAGDCAESGKNAGTISTITGAHDRTQIDTIPPIAWASSNPETIGRNQNITLAVTGGKAPYTWTVQGTNFTLASQSTTDGNNQLTAGGSACGSAKIEVTESGGQNVTGHVRCSTGKWVSISTDYSCITGASIGILCEEIVGNRMHRVWGSSYYYGDGPCKCNGPFYCLDIVCTVNQWGTAHYWPGVSKVEIWEWRCN